MISNQLLYNQLPCSLTMLNSLSPQLGLVHVRKYVSILNLFQYLIQPHAQSNEIHEAFDSHHNKIKELHLNAGYH